MSVTIVIGLAKLEKKIEGEKIQNDGRRLYLLMRCVHSPTLNYSQFLIIFVVFILSRFKLDLYAEGSTFAKASSITQRSSRAISTEGMNG
jgi:hypothetical protein